MTEERWLPVVGSDGSYEVSDLGRVRSLPRVRTYRAGGTRLFPGQMLNPFTGTRYLRVKVCGRISMVHQVVAAAFLGPRPADMPHIRHLNGNSQDNRLVNLRYGSVSENQRDRRLHGTDPQVNRTHCPQDHAYTPGNLRADKLGHRKCRLCHRAREAQRRLAKKAAAQALKQQK